MSDSQIFWIGFCTGALSGATALFFVVEFARWLLKHVQRNRQSR